MLTNLNLKFPLDASFQDSSWSFNQNESSSTFCRKVPKLQVSHLLLVITVNAKSVP